MFKTSNSRRVRAWMSASEASSDAGFPSLAVRGRSPCCSRNALRAPRVPDFLSVIFFYFLPESPRWLLLHGRVDEARIVLEKAVKRNGKVWPEGFELKRIETEKSEEQLKFVLENVFKKSSNINSGKINS